MPKIPLHGKHGEGKYAIVDEEDYEPLSKLRWKVTSNGYVYREMRPVEGVRGARALHHDVLGITDPDRLRPVDHRNRNPLDNRRSNLVRTTPRGNLANRSQYRSATGVKYVYPIRDGHCKRGAKFSVVIEGFYVGSFRTKAEAVKAASLIGR